LTKASFITILLLNLWQISFGQNTVQIDKNPYKNLGKDVVFFVDKTNKLNINKILLLPDTVFKQGNREIINGNLKGNNLWLKAKYINSEQIGNYIVFDYGNIDYIDIFYKNDQNNLVHISSGNFGSFAQRAFISSEFVFHIPQSLNKPKELIVRLQAKNTLIAAIKIVNAKTLTNALFKKYAWQISLIGLAFAFAVFHLFMFIYTRNKLFVMYIIRVIFLFYLYVVAYLNGFGNFLGETGSRFVLTHAQCFAAIGFVATILFNISYLGLKKQSSKFLEWFYFLIGVWILIFIFSIWDTRHYINRVAQVMLLLTSFTILLSSINKFYSKSFRQKSPFFVLYILGCIPICVVTIYFVLTLVDVFPLKDYSLKMILLSSIIEGILITLAILGDKIYHLQMDKNIAEFKTYKLIKERNEFLEENIAERTQELLVVNNELKLSNDFKNKLFSIISHDMRSPLSSLAMVLQVAEKNLIEPESFAKMLSNIRKNTQQVQNIMDNLLNWSIAQMNLQKYTPEEFLLNDFLKEQLALYENLAAVKNINTQVICADNLYVYADRNQLSLIIRNLVDNAIKFTPQNGLIELGIKDDFTFYIGNSGIPISNESINNILGDFDGLKSSNGTNNERGTGLGLRLCIEYIKNFDSKLNITSLQTDNLNTIFSFKLPVIGDKYKAV
jgi:signal transduction histidine kinase